jgi:integrase
MACRKDGKGRVLRKGEHYRKTDGRYSYIYTDPLGKKRTIYAKSLVTLRQKEDELVRDQMDGLNVYVAGSADVNFLFDRYISTKTELRSTTKANYLYTWDHFIRDTFGKKKIKDVKYSDVLFFYTDLITNKGLQVNTLESINTVLRPTFELAVRDDIIRRNPVNGAYAEVKKRNGGARKSRRALTVEQQREFIDYVAKNPFFFHWYPFFVFLLGTGCRIGEAIGIRWDDVDMKKRTININHSLTYYTRSDNSFKCEFRVSEPKTEAGIRTIPMMGPVYEVLKSEYQRQQEEGFCVAEVDGMTNFIFTNRFGNPHNPQAVNVSKSTSSSNKGSIFTFEKSIFSSTVAFWSQFSASSLLAALFSLTGLSKLFIVGSFFAPAVKSCKMIYISLNHYNIFFSKLY